MRQRDFHHCDHAPRGSEPYLEGPTTVEAEAIVRDHGVVVDSQEWTRKV